MGIQPIDLSTIYSQMDKIGQMNASQAQSATMASRQHLEKTAQQETEKSQTVLETKDSKESSKIKADVNQGGGAGQGLLQEKNEQNEELSLKPESTRIHYEITDPKLGRHIDVTG